MIISPPSALGAGEVVFLPTNSLQPRWYAIYTSANHEKRVADHLKVRSVQHFLPLYESVRRWKDRRMKLQRPLFPGYVFVRVDSRDRLRVLQVPGVVRLVGFRGMPTPLQDEEMMALRAGLEGGVRAQPHPYLKRGHRVTVKDGPLMGLQGILVRRKNQGRLVISVDLIQRSVAVEMDEASLALGKQFGRERSNNATDGPPQLP